VGASSTLNLGLDFGGRVGAADQFHIPTSPRGTGQGKHGDRFKKVGLALSIGPQKYVQVRGWVEIQMLVIPVVAQDEPDDAQPGGYIATRMGMIT